MVMDILLIEVLNWPIKQKKTDWTQRSWSCERHNNYSDINRVVNKLELYIMSKQLSRFSLILVCFIAFIQTVAAQDFEWFEASGGTRSDKGTQIVADEDAFFQKWLKQRENLGSERENLNLNQSAIKISSVTKIGRTQKKDAT